MKITSTQGMKGGVGKSVNAVHAAGYLAYKKKRVLIIDGDYQANTSLFFGGKRQAMEQRASLYEVLIGVKTVRQCIVKTDFPFLDLLPATNELCLFNEKSQDRYTLRTILRDAKLEKDYDHIIIDSRPELSDLFRNIAIASDNVILPILPDADAIDGLSLILKSLRELSDKKKAVCGEHISLIGSVVNNYDKRFSTHVRLIPIIREALADKGIRIIAEVARTASISSSQDAGRPLAFMPKHRSTSVGQAFAAIGEEILKTTAVQKGRTREIPLFSDKERARITDRLYDEVDEMSAEVSL